MKINPEILFNAIRDAVLEMEKSPYDDVSTIWNEQFESWKLPLTMDDGYHVAIDTNKIEIT